MSYLSNVDDNCCLLIPVCEEFPVNLYQKNSLNVGVRTVTIIVVIWGTEINYSVIFLSDIPLFLRSLP